MTAKSHALSCHASCRGGAVRSLVAEAVVERGRLCLRYTLEGELARLCVPQVSKPRPVDGLWQHTCFEAFVGDARGRYHEFNFSASGEWAAYAFAAYRERDPIGIEIDPRIETHGDEHSLVLSAQVFVAALPYAGGAPWRIGLSAVVEDTDGTLSYWALHHPSGRPDFHHVDGFVLELAAAE